MNRRQFFVTTSAASLALLPLVGCGGGKAGSSGRGRVQLALRWPEVSTSRLVPAGSASVKVSLLRAGVTVAERKVNRSGSSTATILFENIAVGEYVLQASAHPSADGIGTAQALGSLTVTVSDGVTTDARITMGSTITRLSLAGQTLDTGTTVTLSVTATNQAGETVLVAPSALRWSSSDSSVISVDASGQASALKAGSATISVTDSESGLTATATATINAAPVVPPVPLFLYDRRRSGRSNYASNASGTLKWKFQTGGYIWASPVIGNDGMVYVASKDGKMYAIDGSTGAMKWEFAAQNSVFEMHSTAAIGSDDTLYFGSSGGNIFALDGKTGAVKWTYAAGRPVNSSPLLDGAGILYVGTGDAFDTGSGSLLAIDSSTGTKKWETVTTNGVESSPSQGANGTIYIGDGGFDTGNVYAIDSSTGAIQWTWAAPSGVESSPSIGEDGTVYVGVRNAGGLFALNPNTGSLIWSYSAFDVRDCPSIGADGSLYFGSSDNNIYALTSSGQLKWKFQTGDQCKATPVLTPNGVLYGGGKDGFLYALNASTGTQKWKFDIGDYMFSTPAIAKDGSVVFTSFDGAVYALS